MLLVSPKTDALQGAARRAAPYLGFHALTLGVVATVIGLLTLFKNHFVIAGLWDAAAHNQRSLDLQLLDGFIGPPIWYGPWTNTLGNIALFLPLGFLLYLLLFHRLRYPILGTFLIGAATSLGIEIAQFIFAAGYSDVDDLLTNSLGALFGAWVAARMGARSQLKTSTVILVISLGVLAAASAGQGY
ncbi:VanZ family protein [Corynebacterium sp. A21]|uniref:VanZ family protein n=1 Tax=Corynebacterium sp. A21 TaxID=3457318 RepID=UPI003FD467A6